MEMKVVAALIYFSGLSYRMVSSLVGYSHEAVRLWYNALKDALPKPEKRNRRCIAVDETKLGKEQLYIWAARDIETKEVLAVSFTRSSLDAEIFLKNVLERCDNKPTFLVDKKHWYREAFERLGLEYRRETQDWA
ncbi:MAG: hypothetical protein ACPLY9_06085 [Nitrososphaerales archaeon]